VAKASGPGEFIERRLRAQRLSAPLPADPAAVVGWFGAVQAQDYPGAKWGLALRAPALTDAALDRALADGTILRTHGPRPTWHFIAPADIRSVLTAVAPRVHAGSGSMYRTFEVDAALLARCRRALEKTLGGGRFATRTAIGAAFGQAGIEASGIRLGLLVMACELDQVIVSGPRQGKQFTYALLDERVRGTARPAREDALTALAERYVTSHGPVTIRDFVWWSGLTVGEARRAFAAVSPALREEAVGEATYYSAPTTPAAKRGALSPVHLMPNYDEYFIAYRDRGPTSSLKPGAVPADIYAHLLAVDGRYAGGWRRTVGAKTASIVVTPDARLGGTHRTALEAMAAQHARFLGLPVQVTVAAAKPAP
jgi:hypothetical protein